MDTQELTLEIKQLKESVQNLNGKLAEMMAVNEELRKSNGYLNVAVNNLTDAIKKMR